MNRRWPPARGRGVDAPRLLLHVGLPKTGTSALQRWWHEQAPELCRHGWVYPVGEALTGDKHQFLPGELRGGSFPVLERTLDRYRGCNLIFSSEGLTNHLQDFPRAALCRFRELSAEWRVEIVLATRHRAPWLASFHAQCVVNPANGANELYASALSCAEFALQRRVRRLLDVGRTIDETRRKFGAKRVRVLRYESDPFAAALRVLGLQPEQWPEPSRVNASVDGWLLLLLLELNRLALPRTRHDWWRATLSSLSRRANLEFSSAQSEHLPGVAEVRADLERLQLRIRTALDGADRLAALEVLSEVGESAELRK